MAEIRPTPAPAAPPMPPPPPGGPSSGSSTGKAVSSPIGMNATKSAGGAGGNGGGKGGGGGNKSEEVTEEFTETLSLGVDSAVSSSMAFTPPITFQAAFSQLQKNSYVMAPSTSDISILKKVLKEHSLSMSKGSASVGQIQAAEIALDHMATIKEDLNSIDFTLSDGGLHDLESDFDETYADLAADPADSHDRGILEPARGFSPLAVKPEYLPETELDEAHFHELITDPRSGFAPEGFAAWELERSKGVTLARAQDGIFDYVETATGAAWSLLPLSGPDQANDLARLSKKVAGGKGNILIDTNGLTPSAAFAGAIRTANTNFSQVRMHLSSNIQER